MSFPKIARSRLSAQLSRACKLKVEIRIEATQPKRPKTRIVSFENRTNIPSFLKNTTNSKVQAICHGIFDTSKPHKQGRSADLKDTEIYPFLDMQGPLFLASPLCHLHSHSSPTLPLLLLLFHLYLKFHSTSIAIPLRLHSQHHPTSISPIDINLSLWGCPIALNLKQMPKKASKPVSKDK